MLQFPLFLCECTCSILCMKMYPLMVLIFLHNLQAILSSWQNFEAEREKVWRFISTSNSELHKELIFNSLDSLRTELEHNKVCVCVFVIDLESMHILYALFLFCQYLAFLFCSVGIPQLLGRIPTEQNKKVKY